MSSSLEQTFARNGITLDNPTTTLLQSITTENNITPTELYCKWEAWALSNNASTNAPTIQDLTALKSHIQSQSKPTPSRSRIKTESPLVYPAGPTPTRITIDDFFSYADFPDADVQTDSIPTTPSKQEPILQTTSPNTPSHPSPKLSQSQLHLLPTSHTDPAYTARTASGRVEVSYNVAAHDDLPPSVKISPHIASLSSTEPLQYMNDQIPQKINSIRDHTKHLTRLLLKSLELRDVQLPPPAPEAFFTRSSQPVLVLGRVRVELDGGEGVLAGRINPNSVLLESEDGNMVKLDLSRVQERQQPLFLAPGMVVAVEGVNTNERVFEVHNVYDNAMQVSKREGVVVKEEGETMQDDLFVSAIVAAGPFTTSTNLSFEPLEDLLHVIEKELPQLVILTGPFIDANHPQVSESTAAPFEAIFESKILARIRQLVSEVTPAPHVVLVPSLDDVHHEPVCPQPPFEWPEGQRAHPNISLLSNPCVLDVSANGSASSIGVSSLPSLQDLSADCICWNKGDRFSAIVSHMLRQRSFYPCFPPSTAVPLDTTYLSRIAVPELPDRPTVDVIFTPSKLKAFVKSVDGGAVAVNPGLLCRGSSGGTYAELRIPLHKKDASRALDANEVRLQGNIIRI